MARQTVAEPMRMKFGDQPRKANEPARGITGFAGQHRQVRASLIASKRDPRCRNGNSIDGRSNERRSPSRSGKSDDSNSDSEQIAEHQSDTVSELQALRGEVAVH